MYYRLILFYEKFKMPVYNNIYSSCCCVIFSQLLKLFSIDSSEFLWISVICRPYYVPHSEMGFVGQHPKVLLPGTGIRRMPRNNCFEVYQQMQDTSVVMSDDHHQQHHGHFMMRNNKETLQLFPLQPTGFLDDKTNSVPVDATTSPTVPPAHRHNDHEDNSVPPRNQPFFDFLSSSQ